MYFDTGQCGTDSIQHLTVLTPGVFTNQSSNVLLTVGTGFGQFSAETQNSWSGPEDPNCLSPQPLGSTDGFEVYARIGSIQYQSGSNFVAIPGTLFVLKDTTVTFKAIPDPPGGNLRSTPTWSGTSGATGSGVTKAVTFSTVSSSATDFKTVIATSGNSVTVNVIVYDLTGTFTPENNFSGRSLENFGIEEVVTLGFTATPSVSVSQIGGLRWRIVNTGTGNGTLSANDVGTGTFNAPDTAKAITLAIKVLDGPGARSTAGILWMAPKAFHRHTRQAQRRFE